MHECGSEILTLPRPFEILKEHARRAKAPVCAATLLSSSMAEHSAVNRRVVGSSPTSGAIFQSVRATHGRRFRYRGKYRGLRLNCGAADAFHRSPQFIQSEVSVTRCHAYHRRRAPSGDLRNLGDGNSRIQHPRYSRVPKIVEAARQWSHLRLRVRSPLSVSALLSASPLPTLP